MPFMLEFIPFACHSRLRFTFHRLLSPQKHVDFILFQQRFAEGNSVHWIFLCWLMCYPNIKLLLFYGNGSPTFFQSTLNSLFMSSDEMRSKNLIDFINDWSTKAPRVFLIAVSRVKIAHIFFNLLPIFIKRFRHKSWRLLAWSYSTTGCSQKVSCLHAWFASLLR